MSNLTKALQDYNEMHDKLKTLFSHVSQAFACMNYYGSPEQMNNWSRPDPIQTMMDVYYTLAVPFEEIKQFLEEKEMEGD